MRYTLKEKRARNEAVIKYNLDNPGLSLGEMGKKFGISRARVWQILFPHGVEKERIVSICASCLEVAKVTPIRIGYDAESAAKSDPIYLCEKCRNKLVEARKEALPLIPPGISDYSGEGGKCSFEKEVTHGN